MFTISLCSRSDSSRAASSCCSVSTLAANDIAAPAQSNHPARADLQCAGQYAPLSRPATPIVSTLPPAEAVAVVANVTCLLVAAAAAFAPPAASFRNLELSQCTWSDDTSRGRWSRRCTRARFAAGLQLLVFLFQPSNLRLQLLCFRRPDFLDFVHFFLKQFINLHREVQTATKPSAHVVNR